MPAIDLYQTTDEVVEKADLRSLKADNVQMPATGDLITLVFRRYRSRL
jgi:hypothetical protein